MSSRTGVPPRPPREIVADVIALLMDRYVIITSEQNVDIIEKVCGITRADIQSASTRRARAGWHNGILLPAAWADGRKAKKRLDLQPRPPGMSKRTGPPRKARKGGSELWCTAGKGKLGEPHWASAEEFIVKADAPWTRHSLCDEHRKMYHRARHVKVRALENMTEMGVELSLDEDSNIIGMKCAGCGTEFVKGDTICGTASMRHKGCAEG